jgi:drug/metabolite transporter (DMT)-like permease
LTDIAHPPAIRSEPIVSPPVLEYRSPTTDLVRWAGHWLLHPILVVIIGGLLDAAGEILLKKGANSAPPTNGLLHWLSMYLGVSALASVWTWLGIISYILGLLAWLYVLRFIPISIAFPINNVMHLAVPIGAPVLLHEPVPLMRWFGIGIALTGVLLLLKAVAKAEEKL